MTNINTKNLIKKDNKSVLWIKMRQYRSIHKEENYRRLKENMEDIKNYDELNEKEDKIVFLFLVMQIIIITKKAWGEMM